MLEVEVLGEPLPVALDDQAGAGLCAERAVVAIALEAGVADAAGGAGPQARAAAQKAADTERQPVGDNRLRQRIGEIQSAIEGQRRVPAAADRVVERGGSSQDELTSQLR